MNRIIALAAVLLLTGPLAAACFNTRHVRQVEVAQVVLPSYYPLTYPQQQQAPDDLLRRLVEVLERLESRLDAPAGLTAEAAIKSNCASCHTAGRNPKAGFALVEADGKMAPLSLEDQKLVRLRIGTTDSAIRMPPDRSLAAPILRVILDGLGK